MKKQVVPFLLSSAALCGATLACSQSAHAPGDFVTSEESLYIETDDLWEDVEVPVCWTNAASSNLVERLWVRDQISKTWEFVANVRFTGWGDCEWSAWPGIISVSISDEQPHANWLGESWGLGAMATLNFTYANWNSWCQSSKEYCIRAEAAHEFGHLLAFAHEQNREDTPESCDEEQGSDGDTTFGAWDRDSIMNYCNLVWNNGGELSATDVAGAQLFYGLGQRYIAAIVNAISM